MYEASTGQPGPFTRPYLARERQSAAGSAR